LYQLSLPAGPEKPFQPQAIMVISIPLSALHATNGLRYKQFDLYKTIANWSRNSG